MTVTVDLYQLGAGVLIGLVFGLLLKLRALRRLDMNIQKIGFSMGIEGLDAPENSAGQGQSIWHSTIGGDAAGRDLTKTTNIGKQIQKILGAPPTGPSIKLESRLKVAVEDPGVLMDLNLRLSNGQTDAEWVATCLNHPEFTGQIQAHIVKLAKAGCRVISARIIDTAKDGFYLVFDVQKPL